MSNGFTPFLLAAARGRMLSFEILVGDKRVDVEVVDKDGKKATDLVKAHGKLQVALRANLLLGRRCSINLQSEAEEESAVLKGSSIAELASAEDDYSEYFSDPSELSPDEDDFFVPPKFVISGKEEQFLRRLCEIDSLTETFEGITSPEKRCVKF